MTSMRYILTPAQKKLKNDLEEVLRATGAPGLAARIAEAIPGVGGGAFGTVGAVVALEILARIAPGASAGPAARTVLPAVDPALGRAAVGLGTAERDVTLRLGRNPEPGPSAQALADLASAIEAVRLVLYRAAVLVDSGKKDPGRAAAAEAMTEEIRSRIAARPGGASHGGKE